MNHKEIIACLRRERLGREITQFEIAERAGSSKSDIGGYENGRHLPRLHTLEAWAEVLGYELTLQPKAKP